MPEIESLWIERFYSRYLSRDLAILLAGGLFIEIIWYSLYEGFIIPPLSWDGSLKLIGFFSISYLVGIIFDRIGEPIIHKFASRPSITLNDNHLPFDYKSSLIVHQELINNYDDRILVQLERYLSLLILGKAVGFSFIFGCIFMILIKVPYIKEFILSQYYWILAIFLGFLGFYMLKLGVKAWKRYQEERYYLIEDIISRKQTKQNELIDNNTNK